ncbi:diacylglycerol/lipid kinase family protein [Nannocystaceae bacterium ST9]
MNPKASSGGAEQRWAIIEEALHARIPGLRVRFTEAPGHAGELCREALERGISTILSVGGDGTTNEVLCGFVDPLTGANRFPDATLAVLAAGTGGDFQRMFGRVRVERQVERLFAAPTRTIDYGVARYVDHEGRACVRPFLNVASVGVSGEVVRRVNASDAQLGPTLKYLLGSLEGILGWRNVQVRVRADDRPEQRIDLTLAIVANGQYFGAGMWVCPDAKIDDARFDLLEVAGMSRRTLVATLAKVFGGKHLRVHGVTHGYATRVAFEPVWAKAQVPIEIDGEQVGRLPASFELQVASLRLKIG